MHFFVSRYHVTQFWYTDIGVLISGHLTIRYRVTLYPISDMISCINRMIIIRISAPITFCFVRCSFQGPSQWSQWFWQRSQWGSRYGRRWFARLWGPTSFHSADVSCGPWTLRPLSSKYAWLFGHDPRSIHQGCGYTSATQFGTSTTRHFDSRSNSGKLFSAYTDIVADIVHDIIPWYPISYPISCTISHRLDFFHPWIRKLQVLSQTVKQFLKSLLQSTLLMQAQSTLLSKTY